MVADTVPVVVIAPEPTSIDVNPLVMEPELSAPVVTSELSPVYPVASLKSKAGVASEAPNARLTPP